MIHELRSYVLHPGRQPDFLAHAGDVGLRVRGDDYGKLEGYWASELGLLNQVFHLWSFSSIEERARRLKDLSGREEWNRDYLPKARSMILAQETTMLSAGMPLDPPAGGPHVYELRRYTAHPGKVPEWLALFKEVAQARNKLSRIVGVWSTEIGTLNQIVHLWCYRDLNERAAVRAKAMQDPSWRAFLGKVPPLVIRMESTILVPAPFSPMK
jgi:hypothetical protein